MSLGTVLRGMMVAIVGMVLLWQSVQAANLNRRLAQNPHARATVERTWVTSGKNASRYADIGFPGPIGIGLCHTPNIRLGPSAVRVREGDIIDIAPTPGSCAAPDAASARESPGVVSLEFFAAFAAFICGVLMALGIMPSGRRGFRFARGFG